MISTVSKWIYTYAYKFKIFINYIEKYHFPMQFSTDIGDTLRHGGIMFICRMR